jgi:hypothetical protein
LRRLHAALLELEGPNDGLVSVESASAFGTPLPCLPVDHLRQVDWMKAEHTVEVSQPTAEIYARITANLAGHGFAATDGFGSLADLPGPQPVARDPDELRDL